MNKIEVKEPCCCKLYGQILLLPEFCAITMFYAASSDRVYATDRDITKLSYDQTCHIPSHTGRSQNVNFGGWFVLSLGIWPT